MYFVLFCVNKLAHRFDEYIILSWRCQQSKTIYTWRVIRLDLIVFNIRFGIGIFFFVLEHIIWESARHSTGIMIVANYSAMERHVSSLSLIMKCSSMNIWNSFSCKCNNKFSRKSSSEFSSINSISTQSEEPANSFHSWRFTSSAFRLLFFLWKILFFASRWGVAFYVLKSKY